MGVWQTLNRVRKINVAVFGESAGKKLSKGNRSY
jgi:hypothetical protein